MTDAPKLPEPTGTAIHRALRRVHHRHHQMHEHHRRAVEAAYPPPVAPAPAGAPGEAGTA